MQCVRRLCLEPADIFRLPHARDNTEPRLLIGMKLHDVQVAFEQRRLPI